MTGSPASTNPELNFLVYVPSTDQYPLYIKDDQGNCLLCSLHLIYTYNKKWILCNVCYCSVPQSVGISEVG